jgi:nitrate/nitrite-specific signal transduction histidine kinase
VTDSKPKAGAGTEPDDPEHLAERRKDVRSIFKRGLEFTEDLLQENERLRFQVAGYEEEVASLRRRVDQNAMVRDLATRVTELEQERVNLLDRYRTVEDQNRDFSRQYTEIEEAHNNLANLYVSSYQLHSTLVFHEVLQIVCEILLNLVGAREFAIYVLDEATKVLHPLVSEGSDAAHFKPVPLGHGPIGKAVADNAQHVVESSHLGTPDEPLAIIPLVVGDLRVGAIVLVKLLVQKPSLSGVDLELFALLGAHAATALRASAQNGAVTFEATADLYRRLWKGQGVAGEGA